MNDSDLLLHIERSQGREAGWKQLIRELGLGEGHERRLLEEQLARLTAQGRLIHPDRDRWALPQAAARQNLASGRLDLHREGFGFVRPLSGQKAEDIFIPPGDLLGAMQGDQVLVELAPPRPDGRRSGRVVRILLRQNPTVVGVFHHARGGDAAGDFVIPSDRRMTQPIVIPFGSSAPAENPHRAFGGVAIDASKPRPGDPGDLEGMVVDVEITGWPGAARAARGRILEILGNPDDFGVDVEIVIRKHHLPHVFPPDVLEEAAAVAHLDEREISRRRDFRHLPIVTIDGETAKDFDDAVLARKDANGWQLQVHIADVAHYVRDGSSLDREARLRGTSVYFPDRAVPMLPQQLSSGICSLRPEQDRLVLSCLMRVDLEGEIESYRIFEGVIRSARRATYAQVHAAIEGDEGARREFGELTEEFEGMYELARLLHAKRQRRGSIDFDLPEPVIEFDASGAMRGIVRSERSWANRLIEEFMLSANECVASWLEQSGAPSLYRIHEKPEARRVVEFEDQAAAFGYSLGLGPLPVKRMTMKADRRERRASGSHAPRVHEVAGDIPVTPEMYQRLALKIAGKPEERILSRLMLRSLRQARYSEKNEGHFALAAPCYTHFTSPIRRYPDLIVHRIVKALLRAGVSGHGIFKSTRKAATAVLQPPDETELAAVAHESSEAERRAEEAERELMEWKKVKFMQARIGEDFDAMILSVTKYGCFVELDNLFIEGLVPIASLEDDLYTFRENTRQIIGERFGRRYSIGDRVRIALDRVDMVERRLQFSIFEDLASAAQRPKKSKPNPKHNPAAHPYRPPKAKTLRKLRGKNKEKSHARGKKRR